MKNAIGMSRMYIHRPSRENAISFVCTLGAMIMDVMNHILKERGIDMTYARMVEELQILFLRYDRERDEEFLSGPSDLTDMFLNVAYAWDRYESSDKLSEYRDFPHMSQLRLCPFFNNS